MSRCFPYPPPGYSLNRGSKEALIESIKRDKERVKAEKKKEKKEKKEKRREKKEKKKEKKDEKGRESEIEHLERSNLTEEHEKAIGYQNPTSSSDSTHNSSKRKRPIESSEEEQAIRGGHGGKVVKIRLSSQKQKVVEAPIICKEPCSTSTSGRTDVPITVPTKTHLVPGTVKGNVSPTLLRTNSAAIPAGAPFRTNSAVHGAVKANILPKQVGPIPGAVKENISPTLLRTNRAIPGVVKDNIFPTQVAGAVEVNSVGLLRPPRPDKASKEVVCSTSGRRESIIKEDKRNALGSEVAEKEKKLSRGELKYKNLIENWNPPPLVVEKGMELDDEDWLFSTSTKKNVSEKKLKTSENALCSSSAMLWPRAQLLPEVDIYALPYTIPF